MVTLIDGPGYYGRPAILGGLSTDKKPVGPGIGNGSLFVEIDTGARYRFDAETGVWVLQPAGGGGGGTLGTKQVSENGVYDASDDGVDGFSRVTVDVPAEAAALEPLSVAQNGTYTPGSGVDGFDEVTVAVPEAVLEPLSVTANGVYTPETGVDGFDEVTVSVQGAAVLESLSVTRNGTFAPGAGVDGFDEVTVAVPGATLGTLSVTGNGVYTPGTGVDGFSAVTVAVPTVNRGMLINVTAPTGSVVTATKDGVTYTGTESPAGSGSFTVEVPEYGTYTVTATLNGNVASKTVVIDRESAALNPVLPAGYTELEYLQSSGAQYLNIGLRSADGHRWAGRVWLNANSGDIRFLGCHSAAPYGRDECGVWNVSGRPWLIGTPLALYSADSAPQTGVLYSFDVCMLSNRQNITIDGVSRSLSSASPGPGSVENLDRYLFAENYNNESTSCYLSGRLYALSVYSDADGLEPVARFYPARRESDGELGMYDTVRQQFFTNAGSGTFIAGPEV